MVDVISGTCSRTSMDSLVAYMQQTLLQYLNALVSLEPTHWTNARVFGSLPSEGLPRCPPVGPDAERPLSSCIDVMTSLHAPRPYCGTSLASERSNPVATTTAAASSSIVRSFCSKSIAPAWQTFLHIPHLPEVIILQWSASIVTFLGTA